MKLPISLAAGACAAASLSAVSAFAPARSVVRGAVDRAARRRSLPRAPSPSSLFMAEGGDDWEASKSAMIGGAGVNNAGEPPFEIRGFSLGNFILLAGFVVTALSFAEYLGTAGGDGLNVSGLGFVYGVPIMLGGAALKYAEINPVPCVSGPGAEAVFEAKATETIQKIKQDVTRHRYGDEAHLDTSVRKLGLVVPGKDYPQLVELREVGSMTSNPMPPLW